MINKKNIIIAVFVIAFLGVLAWLYNVSTQPLPGQRIEDLGRQHVEVGTNVEYNSNPPTSGPHYADWIRPGVYTTPKDDRNLVHSLEHGYVIMFYNCAVQPSTSFKLVKDTFAHGVEEEIATESASEATSSSSLSPEFASEECHTLVDQLISIYEKNDKKKLIVAPRPNLDTRIALTAWTYIDKFNEFDEQRIIKFIDAHRDHGPEQTMEEAGN